MTKQAQQTVLAAELPERGQPLAGGVFVTRYWLNGVERALVLPPDELSGPWGEYGIEIKGAGSYSDGEANTRAMAEAGSVIAVKALELDGFIPSCLEGQLLMAAKADGLVELREDRWHHLSTQRSANNAYIQNFHRGSAPMAKFEPGETFGRLTVTRWDSASSVQCICSCGTAFVGVAGNMRSGATQSCGCIRKEKNNHVTHGHTGSLTHKRWRSMRARCLNKNASNYPQYGGSGIGICAEWDDFERFLADMGECPGECFTLDREDGNKGYSPGNCRWATRVQQARNQSTNKLITFRGETLGLSEWAEKLGIKSQTIQNRLRKGWTVDEALGTTGDARSSRKSRAE